MTQGGGGPGPHTILLARHGRTAYNAEERFQGQCEVPLDATGIEQAQELASTAAAHGFVRLVCSPLRRAQQTAEIVAGRLGLSATGDERFMETDTGDWTHRLFSEVAQSDPEGYAAYQRGGDFRFPGGESLREQQARVLDGLADVRAAGELPALVVTHRGSIRCVLAERDPRGLDAFQSFEIANTELVPA